MGFGQSKSEFVSTIGNAGATPVTPGFRPETLKKPKNQTQVTEDPKEQSNSSPRTHIHTQINVFTSAAQQKSVMGDGQEKKTEEKPSSQVLMFGGSIENIGNFNPGGNNEGTTVENPSGLTEEKQDNADSANSSAGQHPCHEKKMEKKPSGQDLTFRGSIRNIGNFNPGGDNIRTTVRNHSGPTQEIPVKADSRIPEFMEVLRKWVPTWVPTRVLTWVLEWVRNMLK